MNQRVLVVPDEPLVECYRRFPRTLNEAFGPYARFDIEENKPDRKAAIISMVVIALLAAAFIMVKHR